MFLLDRASIPSSPSVRRIVSNLFFCTAMASMFSRVGATDNPGQSRMIGGGFQVTDTKELYSAKWIRLVEYTYVTPEGQERKWELCERTTRAGIADAVDVLAILRKEGEAKKIILVKQFRPPLKGYTIEMPAGLVDAGESAETAAVRELQEETGYTGFILGKADPPIVTDAGITNSNFQMTTVLVDGDDPVNSNPKPALEDSNIETIAVPVPGLKARLNQFIHEGVHVDSRLYHFAAGVELAHQLML